ncbi:MAG: alpha/beta hydrolase family protein [Pseudomarimonas sp.]
MKPTYIAIRVFLCLMLPAISHAAPTLEQLAAAPTFGIVSLSPDGRHVAIARPDERRSTLLIVDADSLDVVSELAFPDNEHVLAFTWVNSERLVVSNGTATGSLGRPQRKGELFAVSLDGSKRTYLFGYRAGQSKRNRGREGDYSHGFVINTLHANAEELLIGEYNMGAATDGESKPTVHRVNAYSGARTEITKAPLARAWITTDLAGDVRFASGWNEQNLPITYRRAADGEWSLLDMGQSGLGSVQAFGFEAGNMAFHAAISEAGEPACIYRVHVANLQRERLACDAQFESNWLMPSSRRGQPLGVWFEAPLPRLELFDSSSDDAQLYLALQQQLAPASVRFLGFSEDGQRVLVEASSDRDAGRLYLFDRKTQRARLLFARKPELDPNTLGATQPFAFNARDGLRLHGFLTLPASGAAKALPLVVMPHGGPFGIDDRWEYDPDVQMLATRGYAVLKVNFRGSGGRGESFQRLGYKQWGGSIQDDIVDATRWAIDNGFADAKRVCLMGASFGAYSALMSAIRAPDLFRCAIGYAGVYDLDLMFSRGDIRRSEFGRRYLDEAVGDDAKALAAQSPAAQVEHLQAPVLLVHGGADVRAPLAHAEAMRHALKKSDKSYEWMVVEDEAHGFYRAANRLAYYERALGFLEKHIGKQMGRTSP